MVNLSGGEECNACLCQSSCIERGDVCEICGYSFCKYNEQMKMRLKADLTLLLVAVIWGTAFAAQRVAAQVGSVFMFNGLRFLLGALVLLPLTGFRWNFSRRDWRLVFFAGMLLFAGSALQQMGMQSTTAGNAGFITGVYVVLVPIVLFVGWRERPHWLAWVAAFMALAGAFLLSTGGGEFILRFGDSLELLGAFFWSLHVVILGKFAPRVDPIRFSAGQFIVGGGLNLLVGLIFENPVSLLQPMILGGILYTGIFSVGVAFTLQVVGQRHTPPADAALIMSLEGVMGAFFGWWWLNESLLPLQLLGCALIFASVILAQVKEFQGKKNSGLVK